MKQRVCICQLAVLIPALVAALLAFGAEAAWAESPTWLCVPKAAGKAVTSGGTGTEGKCEAETTVTELPPATELPALVSILSHMKYVASGIDSKPTIKFEGVNVQILDGEGKTATTNGEGNLVIGYDENPGKHSQTGSHDLILGEEQTFTSYGSVLAGLLNSATAPFSSVTGGAANAASGKYGSVGGGEKNTVSGEAAWIGGGQYNESTAQLASVAGGWSNRASKLYAFIGGGGANIASGEHSSISGGGGNTANGYYSSVTGGYSNTASGSYSSTSGGDTDTAFGLDSWIAGGYNSKASGEYSSTTGGRENQAEGPFSSVFGSKLLTAAKEYEALL
ncbi:MAG: hypothetical protein ABR992_01630 [Solirubrobacteraceae bacterium]|jgi:hypothetical protein